MYFACARSERSSVENNFRIMPKPHARCTFKTIYKTSTKFPKDRNKIEEELRSQITTHCIRDWQKLKLKVHKLKKVKNNLTIMDQTKCTSSVHGQNICEVSKRSY